MKDAKLKPKKSKSVEKELKIFRIVRRQNVSLNDIKEMEMRKRKEWMIGEQGWVGRKWKKVTDTVKWVNWRRQRRMAAHNLSIILLSFIILMLSITTMFMDREERHGSIYLSKTPPKVNPIVEMSKAGFQKYLVRENGNKKF